MSPRLLIALVVVLATAVIGLALFWQPQLPSVTSLSKAPAGGDFVLDSADGPLDTTTLRGKLVLVYFGYTYCPDICPTSLAVTGQALNQLSPDEQSRVRIVFVSVDPDRDTPARLKDYAAFFHPNMIGVTGSKEQVSTVARLYGASYAFQDVGSSAGYVVDHSAWTYVVAPDGRLAHRIPLGAGVEQTLAEIRKQLHSLLHRKERHETHSLRRRTRRRNPSPRCPGGRRRRQHHRRRSLRAPGAPGSDGHRRLHGAEEHR